MAEFDFEYCCENTGLYKSVRLEEFLRDFGSVTVTRSGLDLPGTPPRYADGSDKGGNEEAFNAEDSD